MRQIRMNGYVRVTRSFAKKSHKEGRVIYMLPSNMRPNEWVVCSMVAGADFEAQVNAFSYYNCNTEAGNNVFFYVKEQQ